MPDAPAPVSIPPLVEARGLGKSYGFKRVLDAIDLSIRAGEIVAVLGINGAGKTTLLACLSGILGWTRGEVLVVGRRLDRADLEMRRRLLFMPYDGLDFQDVDAIRNAAMFSELWRGIDATPPPDLEIWIERLGLAEIATDRMDRLSRGQRYKAALLALHCADPEIWLLDEPFAAGMDARGMEVFRQMARAATQRGRCVIYTTQFPELAARFATRILVLGHGGVSLDESTTGADPESMTARLGRELGIPSATP